MGLRPTSNKARRPLARKPSGRRFFCPWPALAHPLQPAAGMRRARRLGQRQNPQPQHPLPFSDRLLADFDVRRLTFLLIGATEFIVLRSSLSTTFNPLGLGKCSTE